VPIGLIEIIGGSYLSASPQLSYKRLLEGLSKKGFAIHAWQYIPAFDHQAQANQAWKDLRKCRKKLELRVGKKHIPIRLGHSLGCKLLLLSPDGGRNSKASILISFNNFNATKSIPMLRKLSLKLNFQTEFSPDPQQTLQLISEHYFQSNNLLINFKDDKLDQSPSLLKHLQKRSNDDSTLIELKGNHMTPASAGLRQSLLGEWANNSSKENNIATLIGSIYNYSTKKLSP
tara:strand:+ start:6428 stop:7120 length:693 start_codon:yes stop_codon:yes gene_type:complete